MAGKGRPKTGGRAKGTPNKLTADVKAMILEALEKAHPEGSVAYLVQQAQTNPTPFLSLVGKVLPMTVAGDANNPVATSLTVTFVKPD